MESSNIVQADNCMSEYANMTIVCTPPMDSEVSAAHAYMHTGSGVGRFFGEKGGG